MIALDANLSIIMLLFYLFSCGWCATFYCKDCKIILIANYFLVFVLIIHIKILYLIS